jgi:transcriptional regulator with XRE-family HTH domain
MVNLSKSICFKFAEARRKEGLSQSLLAEEVGCMQSAISMFEKGNVTKLSEETIIKLSKRLNVPLEEEKSPLVSSISSDFVHLVHGFCPDCSCPSNVPYLVGDRLFFRPSRHLASPSGGKRCALCGEVLELRCPVCGAALNDGACCGMCGTVYVTPALPEGTDLGIYTRIRVEEISKFRSLS